MEKLFLITFIMTLNALYWANYLKTFDDSSTDGCVGKAIVGIIILACSGVFVFNLDTILKHI